MDSLAWSPWYKPSRFGVLTSGLCVAGVCLSGSGCAQFRTSAALHGSAAGMPWTASSNIIAATYRRVDKLPPAMPNQPTQGTQAAPSALPMPQTAQTPPVLPIGLDTVFRLAEEQNAQVGVARAKLQQACAQQDVASWRWLPDLYVGTSYYRHEGGIADENGFLVNSSFGSMFAGGELAGHYDLKDIAYQQVNAQRQVWQQRGELSKITSQTFLDAASTYIDWLTARSGEAVARKFQKDLRDLLGRAEQVAAVVTGTAVEVARIRAELDAEDQAILRLRQQQQAAQAKLLYLLGLDPCSTLIPIDAQVLPFDLVDATPPICDLVSQALQTGPGITEMQGLLNLIHQSMERAQGPGKYLPVFDLHVAEGGFGTGPGDRMDWDNRLDIGLQARWNLTDLVTLRDRRRVAQAAVQQAHLAYQDLQGKLTAGVQEAREAILSGKDQIAFTRQQIVDASRAFSLSDRRLRAHVGGATYTEALLALESYGRAERNYLEIVNAYDKAQLRLLILLGPNAGHAAPLPSAPHAPQTGP